MTRKIWIYFGTLLTVIACGLAFVIAKPKSPYVPTPQPSNTVALCSETIPQTKLDQCTVQLAERENVDSNTDDSPSEPSSPTRDIDSEPIASETPKSNDTDTQLWPEGRYRNSVFDSVVSHEEIVYKNSYETVINEVDGYYEMAFDTNQPRQLKINVYEPAGDTLANRPLIVFVHGGGWTQRDRNQRVPEAIAYAKMGYTTASIDYTILPPTTPDPEDPQNLAYFQVIGEGAHNLHEAYQYLINHSDEYNIDTSQTGLAGWSAGGFNINVAIQTNIDFEMPGVRAVLATSSLFPPEVAGAFGGFRTFNSSFNPITKFVSNAVDDAGSITFIDDCAYLDSIDHRCSHELVDGVGHDLEFHLPPLKDVAVDYLATYVAGE